MFGESLWDAELARIAVDCKRLKLEREIMVLEKEEREKNYAIRREERESKNELERQKFKIMM